MSESERRKLERDIVSRKRDIKREQEEFREDLNIRRNESFDKLRRRVYEVIVDIAKKEKTSINHLVSSALGEKITAIMTEEYIDNRAKKGSKAKFKKALKKVADIEADELDK